MNIKLNRCGERILLSAIVILSALCRDVSTAQIQGVKPRTFLLDAKVLSCVRDSVRTKKRDYAFALKRLVRDADKALEQAPVSVMEKQQIPPSGDKHDYMSLAPYWWPDPNKADGLPYIRRDGEVNPKRDSIKDKQHLNTLATCTHTLGLAYYYTGNEAYAQHAIAMIRTWFLQPETRMNPNLNFGQAVRGHNTGRGAGLIETSRFRYVIDAVGLIGLSKSWSQADAEGIRSWFREYFKWLKTSENGSHESKAKNNHGTWYDVQAVSIAMFLGDTAAATSILREAASKRIATQIEPDGRQPFELVRTKALGYSTMNLEGFFCLAALAERAGINLWHYATSDGRSIKQALDWLLPFYSQGQKWPYQQIKEFDYEYVYGMLARGTRYFNDKKYAAIARKLPTAAGDSQRTLLLYGIAKE